MLVWLVLAALGGAAVLVQPGASVIDVLPVMVGFVTWLAVLSALAKPLVTERHHPELESRERRVFLMVAGVSRRWPRSGSPAPAGSSAAVVATSPRAGGCCASTA